MTIKKLTIEHNHGVYVLENVELLPYGDEAKGCRKARGTVVSGGVTNRLFGATSYTPEEKGEIMEIDIWNRHCYRTNADLDHWHVSIVFF